MRQIPESELILNERGAIYHLNLLPAELAPLVITVGDPDRVAEVSKHFDKVEYTSAHREFVTHTGYIGKKRLSVVSTGIGTDNIDIVLTELDALVNVDFSTRTVRERLTSLCIVRLGTCGGLQADIPTDGLIASSFGLGMDNLLNFYTHESGYEEKALLNSFVEFIDLPATVSRPYIAMADTMLLNKFKSAGFATGVTVTCPGFYAPQGRSIRAAGAFPDLLDKIPNFRFGDHRVANFEMETAGLYGMGKLFEHECLSISTVVANRVTKEFSSNSSAAIENMIKRSLEILVTLS